jgi:hypothetical protein
MPGRGVVSSMSISPGRVGEFGAHGVGGQARSSSVVAAQPQMQILARSRAGALFQDFGRMPGDRCDGRRDVFPYFGAWAPRAPGCQLQLHLADRCRAARSTPPVFWSSPPSPAKAKTESTPSGCSAAVARPRPPARPSPRGSDCRAPGYRRWPARARSRRRIPRQGCSGPIGHEGQIDEGSDRGDHDEAASPGCRR